MRATLQKSMATNTSLQSEFLRNIENITEFNKNQKKLILDVNKLAKGKKYYSHFWNTALKKSSIHRLWRGYKWKKKNIQ